jgi:hypothetical protein
MLLHAAVEAVPPGSAIQIESIRDIPLYDGDLEAEHGVPAAWLPVLRTLGTRPWFEGRVIVSGAGKVFGDDGRVVDAATHDRIRAFVEGFVAFADSQRR